MQQYSTTPHTVLCINCLRVSSATVTFGQDPSWGPSYHRTVFPASISLDLFAAGFLWCACGVTAGRIWQ